MSTHAPTQRTSAPKRPAPQSPPRPWAAVVVIAVAQLMIALDATVVNIALPSAQQALGFSDENRQWVITAYTLTFAGLLLLGGRVADQVGRKTAFLGGLVGFATASAIAGAAPNFAVLATGRALQGACAAVLAPTALSLVAVSFTDPRERAKAFGIYGAAASSGGAAGLILGGALTEYATWRWCLYVNVSHRRRSVLRRPCVPQRCPGRSPDPLGPDIGPDGHRRTGCDRVRLHTRRSSTAGRPAR